MGTGSFLGTKRPRRGVEHPPHLAPMLKKEYSYTSIPPLGLRGFLQGELYLYLYLHCCMCQVWVSFSVSLLFETWAYVGYAPGSSDWRTSYPRDVTWMNKKHQLNVMERGIRRSEVTISTILSTTNPTQTIVQVKPGPRGQKVSTNGLNDCLTTYCSDNVKTQSAVILKQKFSLHTSELKNLVVTAFENPGELLKARHNLWGGINNY